MFSWGAGKPYFGGLGRLRFQARSPVLVNPGPGLARLKVVGEVELGVLMNTDLAFLSSLTCTGYITGQPGLTSLTGLDNVVDGFAAGGYSDNIVFYFEYNPNLTNVSALNAFSRCGTPTQRRDGSNVHPYIKVKGCTSKLSTWTTLCNYSLYGVCPGTPIPPRQPPPPPLRPSPPMRR
jgi:hypothetical protein